METVKEMEDAKIDINELKEIARRVRINILKMLANAGSGHTGGSLSAADIVTALYFAKMRHNPKDPKWPDRDRFILSKGHAAPLLYTVLAECGYFDKSELMTLRRFGSRLQGHPDSKALPCIEISTGSLGQGLSIANGIALAGRLDNAKWRVYALLGDGEVQEGQVWEAAMSAAHYCLDNLCAIMDRNRLQIDGMVEDIMSIEPIADKWRAFGWNVIETDGHDITKLLSAMNDAEKAKGKPTMIIAHTIKGKGVSIFEGKVEYHGIAPTKDELEIALKELEGQRNG